MRPLADYALALIGGFILGTCVWFLIVWLIAKAVMGAVL